MTITLQETDVDYQASSPHGQSLAGRTRREGGLLAVVELRRAQRAGLGRHAERRAGGAAIELEPLGPRVLTSLIAPVGIRLEFINMP